MRKFLIFITKVLCILLMLLTFSCSGRGNMSRLETIDSIINKTDCDSAQHMLDKIDNSTLSEEEQAYYNLLNTEIAYLTIHPFNSESGIDQSISYYSTHSGKDNTRKLANAYFYKGMVLKDLGKTGQTTECLKKAEDIAMNLDDIALSHKIYDCLSNVNYSSGNYELALHYDRLALSVSEKQKDNFWLVNAYNHLGCVFDALGESDSSEYYIRKSVNYTAYVDDKDKAIILGTLGNFYLKKGELGNAGKYLSKAYEYSHLPFVCNALAELNDSLGNFEISNKYSREALRSSSLYDREKILQTILRQQVKKGLYKEAVETSNNITALKDSIHNAQKAIDIQRIQLQYDQARTKGNYDRIIIRILASMIILIVVIALIIIYLARKEAKAKRKLAQDELLINEYNHKIHELQASSKDLAQKNNREIEKLRGKISGILEKQTGALARGHELYKSILEGGNTVTWRKNDILNFIEFYKVINFNFIISLEEEYRDLSPGNKLLLILKDMNMDDNKAAEVLGVSNGAIRTAKSRIRAKKIVTLLKNKSYGNAS